MRVDPSPYAVLRFPRLPPTGNLYDRRNLHAQRENKREWAPFIAAAYARCWPPPNGEVFRDPIRPPAGTPCVAVVHWISPRPWPDQPNALHSIDKLIIDQLLNSVSKKIGSSMVDVPNEWAIFEDDGAELLRYDLRYRFCLRAKRRLIISAWTEADWSAYSRLHETPWAPESGWTEAGDGSPK